ncbi:biotin transporter BioY [Candidatus Chloroploca sp. M-50]|uniref:Biotin transporter n=1 Tax=Candidatus Chloroploca mongolica TaxID=2528176 RepID=A0ABS4D412_9CHLR|nr:biotin transporter BioY [Candidatus Chloroploca mongolica]MBP1464166.1 biotin transporter BioY [Candidatus Chloroploca mongolica]
MTTGVTTVGTLADRLVPARGSLANPIVRDGLLIVAGTILMAMLARISIHLPFTPVPITGQTLGVYLIGALYGPRLGALTLLAYLGQGLLGLPVFSMGTSAWSPSRIPGLPVIFGPTAGYLFAFPVAAAVVGYLANRGWDRKIRTALPAMLAGEAIILVMGFTWLVVATALLTGSVSISALLVAAVLPFLPGAALKIGLASVALPSGWRLFGHR